MSPDPRDGIIPETSYSDSDPEPQGQLATVALSILMGVLYCARMARYDLLRITCKCATRVTKWTVSDDKRLLRLLRYIHSSYELRLVGFVGDPVTEINLSVFSDVDFAGDAISQRSTSGIYLALNGRFTYYPLHAKSEKQTAVLFLKISERIPKPSTFSCRNFSILSEFNDSIGILWTDGFSFWHNNKDTNPTFKKFDGEGKINHQ